MTHLRRARCTTALAALLALAAPAEAQREVGDGTATDAWTLGNGLRVVVRQVPGAEAAAIVVAYPIGRDADPPGQEGLTALMAEVAFTAPAGDVPARSATDLDSQRPVGWNLQVERHRTEFAELATRQQFPGTLHQVAGRMKGVQPSDPDVERARTALLERMQRTIGADPAVEMYVELGQRAAGWDRDAMRRWLSGEGLAAVRARDLAPRIAAAYVPAQAVLSLAGDFEGMNLRAFVEREFGGIPGGTPRGGAMPAGADSFGAARVPHPGVEAPLAGAGLLAPALTDSLHPSFYLTMLLLGMSANGGWNEPGHPSRSRFQYSILDDPDVVRFYPPTFGPQWQLEHTLLHMNGLIRSFDTLTIPLDQVLRVHEGVAWLLGGPLPESLAARVRTDPAILYRLASTAAARELWGGEGFWSDYRARLDPRRRGAESWRDYLIDPTHQYLLLYEPAQGRPAADP